MLRTTTLVMLGLILTVSGCSSTKLQTGRYVLHWEMPRTPRPVRVWAAVARMGSDMVIETVNWESQHLSLQGSMRFGNLRAEAIGSRGMHVEEVIFRGDIITASEAEGKFTYVRDKQKVMEGGWRLVHERVWQNRQAARER
jgi:hypothetical protein